MKKRKMPRQFSMVKFNYENMSIEYHKYYLKVFKKDEAWIFHGEIPNMGGHCILSNVKTGKIVSCYHTDDFIELTEDEV